jgi:hypothetical protein
MYYQCQSSKKYCVWVCKPHKVGASCYVITRVPQYELLRDYKALNTLRELLVIIRIWGLLRQSCLPVFVRSAENLDVLALLFKLLSRLIQTSEADENLLGNLVFVVVEATLC